MATLAIEKEKLSDQVFKKIVSLIEDDTLPIGHKFAAEQVFADRLHISRPILREALQHLEFAGYISRRHGVGTFVIAKKPLLSTGIEKLTSMTELIQSLNDDIGTQDLTQAKLYTSPTIRATLQLPADQKLYVIERVRTRNSMPFEFDEVYIPERYLDQIANFANHEQSILRYLKACYGVEITSSKCTLYAENASSYIAKKLGIKRNSALQVLEQTFFDNHNKVIFVGASRIISQMLKFNLVRRR